MRREPGEHALRSAPFCLGRCLIEPQRDRIVLNGDAVRVEPKVMDLLLALCSRPGQVMSKQELLDSVWQGAFVTEHVLTHTVWQLRKALGDSKLVEAIPKRGYRVTAVALPADSSSGEVESAAGTRPAHSVVVLPVANLTGDPGQEHFAEGMTDALISKLTEVSSLRVLARTSSVECRDDPKAVAGIAKDLNAEAVITGSVFRDGKQVRIGVRLVDARTEMHLWAGSYVRDLEDVFRLQSELAEAIAKNVTSVLESVKPDGDDGCCPFVGSGNPSGLWRS